MSLLSTIMLDEIDHTARVHTSNAHRARHRKAHRGLFSRLLNFLIACHPFLNASVAKFVTPDDQYNPDDYRE